MSYQTYTTEAIVCGSYDRMTADRTYLLFTESAGMVFATARSAREERSKQRYALQDFSHVRVSLVKGKGGWRVGSVEPLHNYYASASDRAARGTVVATVQLLRRLVTGEDAQSTIFSDTHAFLAAVNEGDKTTLGIRFETFTLRLLAQLGYVATHPSYASRLATGTVWLKDTTTLPAEATTAISNGFAASHL
ncbi:MAG TPA: recombination protein O N-terminal domain-containing protein [Candidatus Paceibacterota bacterium]|nr:recombination protein O N-terminal domain-containing protein [Candidatus Paceibacterota bacterium]